LGIHGRPLRNRVYTPREVTPDINLWDIMQNNKILLVDLKDTESDLFLGSLIIAKLQQATFRRRILPEAEYKRFFLYVDEFHAITPSSGEHFEKMLMRRQGTGSRSPLALEPEADSVSPDDIHDPDSL
jgi:hypothetical protein